MELERKHKRCKAGVLSKQVDIKVFVIISMFCIYPLLVIPNELGYFYFPRYIMLGILSILCLLVLIKEKNIKLSVAYIPLALYVICILISSVTASNSQTALLGLFGCQAVPVHGEENVFTFANTARFTGFSTILCCIIMYLTAYKTGKNDKYIDCMIGCAAIVGIIAVLQHFGVNIVPHEVYREGAKPYGTIGNANFMATYFAFILPAVIYRFIETKNKWWLFSLSLIYAGLFVSGTRGAWLSFCVSLLIMGIYYFNKKRIKSFFIVCLCVAIVTSFLLITDSGLLKSKVKSIPDNITSGLRLDDTAGSRRIYTWKQVIKLIPKNWAFGVGPDNLIYCGIWMGSKVVDKAHNIYLETAVTMGIPALIAYLWFLSFFLRKWKTDKGFMFFTMILTYMIQGFFNIDVIMVLPLFWMILGFSQANMEEEKLIEAKMFKPKLKC